MIRGSSDPVRLPGMEILGFYDEPYQIHVDGPRPPRRVARLVAAQHSVPPTHTSEVSRLWDSTQLEESTLDWWKPQVVARRKLGGRQVRLSGLATWLVIAAIGILGIWLIVQRPSQVAEQAATAVQIDAESLTQELPALHALATSLGDDEAPDLTEATATVLAAESAARALFDDAGDLGEEAGPMRDSSIAVASTVLESTSRINRLVAYRLAAERALVEPTVPADPSSVELSAATELVAEWRANIEATLASLPETVLADDRRRLDEWGRSLGTWQAEYLDSVREGDANGMAAALEDQRARITQLRAQLLGDLVIAGDEIAAGIDTARAGLGG